MAMTAGFLCHDSYLQKLKRMDDAQVGRLFRDLMTYHATGEEPQLEPLEAIAFDFIREDIDNQEQAYKEKCEKNRANRTSTNVNERPQSSTNVNEREQSSTNVTNKNKNNNKNNNKNKNKNNNIGFIEPEAAAAINEEQNEVLDEAARAGFPQTNIVRDSLIALFADYGKDRLLTGIHECAEHNGTNLAYLRAVLKGGKKNGKSENNSGDHGGTIQSAYSFLNNRTAV